MQALYTGVGKYHDDFIASHSCMLFKSIIDRISPHALISHHWPQRTHL